MFIYCRSESSNVTSIVEDSKFHFIQYYTKSIEENYYTLLGTKVLEKFYIHNEVVLYNSTSILGRS
jgi:hypothetical protein